MMVSFALFNEIIHARQALKSCEGERVLCRVAYNAQMRSQEIHNTHLEYILSKHDESDIGAKCSTNLTFV